MSGLQITPKTLLLLKIKISKKQDKQLGFTIGFFKPGAKYQNQKDSPKMAMHAIKAHSSSTHRRACHRPGWSLRSKPRISQPTRYSMGLQTHDMPVAPGCVRMYIYVQKCVEKFWDLHLSLLLPLSPKMGIKSKSKMERSWPPQLVQTLKSGVMKSVRAKLLQSTSKLGHSCNGWTFCNWCSDPPGKRLTNLCYSGTLCNRYRTAHNKELQLFPIPHQHKRKTSLFFSP